MGSQGGPPRGRGEKHFLLEVVGGHFSLSGSYTLDHNPRHETVGLDLHSGMLCGRLTLHASSVGHNWGSEHDPTDSLGPCNPASGGTFLMFPSATDATQDNNDVQSNEHVWSDEAKSIDTLLRSLLL